MLHTEQTVRENLRSRDGKRVFFLRKEDRLTPGARDFLTRERVEIRPAEEAAGYRLPWGGTVAEKPEHMTHLTGNVLVPKNHPRIVFRGAMDTLQAELLLCQAAAGEPLRQALGEVLALARDIVRWEVLEEPAECRRLCGLTEEEQRRRSHFPQDFYGQGHFVPAYTDGAVLLALNRCRCAAREAELKAVEAFTDREGVPARGDILRAMNRMSSMIYILMIQEKAGVSRR